MPFTLGVVGSLSQSSAVLVESDGTFVASFENEVSGLHYREMADVILYFALANLIQNLMVRASRKLDVDYEQIYPNLTSVAVAISGLDERFDPLLLLGTLRRILLGYEGEFIVRSIGEACHCGAFLDQPGILIRIGVGCSVFGRDARGKKHLANAWGFLPGDLGASYHIGQQVLHALTRSADGRATAAETEFANRVLALAGTGLSVPEMFDSYRRELPSGGHGTMLGISHLAKFVIELAATEDVTASQILDHSSKQVADGIHAVIAKLHLRERIEVATQGSFVQAFPTYLTHTLQHVRSQLPGIDFAMVPGEHDRAVGVALLALERPPKGAPLTLTQLGRHLLATWPTAMVHKS